MLDASTLDQLRVFGTTVVPAYFARRLDAALGPAARLLRNALPAR